MTPDSLKKFQASIGVFWSRPELLREALTHSSYSFENPGCRNNQRLEFLGDAVLEIVISEHLFALLPNSSEGELTKLRAVAVCEPSLAYVARKINLGRYLRMGRGEELSGGRERPSVLADAFEALLGAMYLDRELEPTRAFIQSMLRETVQNAMDGRVEPDYKTRLQELLQKSSPDPLKYVIIREDGPDHCKTFCSAVLYRGLVLGTGWGRTKKEAEQAAAKQALVESNQGTPEVK
ncbi:MAG: ribonuclease III [Clostridia bacterium]|nr:ribonuclease III [Clostridia bacterium]